MEGDFPFDGLKVLGYLHETFGASIKGVRLVERMGDVETSIEIDVDADVPDQTPAGLGPDDDTTWPVSVRAMIEMHGKLSNLIDRLDAEVCGFDSEPIRQSTKRAILTELRAILPPIPIVPDD